MKEYFKKIRFDKSIVRNDPISGISHLTEKFSAQVVNMQNKAIVEAVKDCAERNGITELVLIDEAFILLAIQNELKRRLEKEQ